MCAARCSSCTSIICTRCVCSCVEAVVSCVEGVPLPSSVGDSTIASPTLSEPSPVEPSPVEPECSPEPLECPLLTGLDGRNESWLSVSEAGEAHIRFRCVGSSVEETCSLKIAHHPPLDFWEQKKEGCPQLSAREAAAPQNTDPGL